MPLVEKWLITVVCASTIICACIFTWTLQSKERLINNLTTTVIMQDMALEMCGQTIKALKKQIPEEIEEDWDEDTII